MEKQWDGQGRDYSPNGTKTSVKRYEPRMKTNFQEIKAIQMEIDRVLSKSKYYKNTRPSIPNIYSQSRRRFSENLERNIYREGYNECCYEGD